MRDRILGRGFQEGAAGFLKLLGSGLLSAAAFTLLASGRTTLMERSLVVFTLLFVQWQTLGLTVVKLGLEQVVFTTVAQDRSLYFSLSKPFRSWVVPLALVYSAVSIRIFGAFGAAALGASLLLDTYSLIVMADFNARAQYRDTALANLLNYPLFILGLCLLRWAHPLARWEILAVFLGSSAIRAAWVAGRRVRPKGARRAVPAALFQVAGQQALNYHLFRADQILLTLALMNPSRIFAPEAFYAAYLFMVKFPEMVAGVLNLVGAVLFPRLGLAGTAGKGWIRKFLQANGHLVLGSLAAYLAAAAVYRRLWAGPSISWATLLPFVLHGAMILVVNGITFAMLSQGRVKALLRNLALASVAGTALGAWMYLAGSYRGLPWIVPAQLAIFILAASILGWGDRRLLYD